MKENDFTKIYFHISFLTFNSAKNARNKERLVFYINIQKIHRNEIFDQFDIFDLKSVFFLNITCFIWLLKQRSYNFVCSAIFLLKAFHVNEQMSVLSLFYCFVCHCTCRCWHQLNVGLFEDICFDEAEFLSFIWFSITSCKSSKF
jgi:hypothetical protein